MMIDSLYTLFNFSFLVAILFYGIKKYSSLLKVEILDQELQKFFFLEQKKNLDQQVHACNCIIDQQVLECKDLANKIIAWKENFQLRQRIQQTERELLNIVLVQRYNKQHMLRSAQIIEARVVPHALAQAQLDLYEWYNKENNGLLYIDKIIKKLS